MIEYLKSLIEEWHTNGGEEPLLCPVCYQETCEHDAEKWPISHLLNKLTLEEQLWTKSNS